MKYDGFVNATELRDKVRRALGNHILTLIRAEGEEAFGPGDRLGRLRGYARVDTAVRILPLVPDCQYNSFRVKSVQSSVVTFEKDSNDQTLIVPAQRIEDVLTARPNEPPTVLLNGRLQWITASEVWRFFPEKPAPDDATGVGFGKEVAFRDPGVPAALQWRWSNDGRLVGHLRKKYSVFYDEDGKYLRSSGQILVVKPRAGSPEA